MLNFERRLKHRLKAQIHSFKANAHIGFETVLKKELSILGIGELETQSGEVLFKAKLEKVWQAIALSRCARNFEMKIDEFHCENFGKLENKIRDIAWELYLPQNCEANIKVFCEKSRLYHKGAVQERVAEGISKRLKQKPAQQEKIPISIAVRLKNDACFIWLNLCGISLHKRGERWVENAPLQETLAASILFYADFAKYEKLIDPMAGSGVFSLEAAKWRSNSSLKLMRSFDFAKMPSFREAAFNNFLQKAKQPFSLNENEKFEILCSDKNPKAIKTIKHNFDMCFSAPEQKSISIKEADFFSLPPAQNALLVLNPPYGKRLGKEKNLYKEIAKKIETDFSQCAFAIICLQTEAEKDFINAFKNRSVTKIQSYNGGLKTAILLSAY